MRGGAGSLLPAGAVAGCEADRSRVNEKVFRTGGLSWLRRSQRFCCLLFKQLRCVGGGWRRVLRRCKSPRWSRGGTRK